ncbi:MAG: YlbF family regulator [Spirochaetes bacterium]|nr:YlbF family regulator [Spirochaetota bacterium]
MQDEIQTIIGKAQELSALIRNHDVTRRYNDCRTRIQKDRKARELYSRLVSKGREINTAIAEGRQSEGQTSENELLQKELEETPLVKEYISSQREYLELLKKVIERIKAPSA